MQARSLRVYRRRICHGVNIGLLNIQCPPSIQNCTQCLGVQPCVPWSCFQDSTMLGSSQSQALLGILQNPNQPPAELSQADTAPLGQSGASAPEPHQLTPIKRVGQHWLLSKIRKRP
ncbi:lysosomal-trafficking regulator [Platysternon megacephalum]|uniref:Lysosomal-trafficking regulator n=1 Tax=Platysternon megacephalum TaxID=55544 RepID=A0A4D9ET16_9SAUR|nr:lysosomal-trafficking regulator [Platysternon megacephalum]